MPRLIINHITLNYAGRDLLTPGASISLEEAELSLPWTYGTDTVGLVGARRAMVVDNGNSSGSLTLPIVMDYPTIDEAVFALAEIKAWADEHTTGPLSLSIPSRAKPSLDTLVLGPGTDNINCVSLELDAMHTPIGYVDSVQIMARDKGEVSGQEVYLSAWEQVSGTNYKLLAVSNNTQVQVAGQWSEWKFSGLCLSGKRMRYAALVSPDTPFPQASVLYVRCFPRPEGDSSFIHTVNSPYSYLPEMTILYSLENSESTSALNYNAALDSLSQRLTRSPNGFRLTSEWEFHLS